MKGQDSKKTLGQAQPKNKTQGVAWGEVLKYRNNWSRGYVPFLCSSSVKNKHLCTIFGRDLSVAQATMSGFPFLGVQRDALQTWVLTGSGLDQGNGMWCPCGS